MMTNMTTMSSTTSNSTDKLPDFVHIFHVEEHNYWKPKILKSIESMIEKNNIQLNEKGYYYDFNIPDVERTYKQIMDNIGLSYIDEIEDRYGLKCEKIQTYWFQQYLQGSDFSWHQHDGHWAMVYYVELPEISESTEFLNFGQFNVKEGDIILFPTFLAHRSPKIQSNLRKTIISSNIQFKVDRKLIQQHGKEYFRH